MTEKELRHLRRQDLLLLMLEQGKELEKLRTELSEATSRIQELEEQKNELTGKLEERDVQLNKLLGHIELLDLRQRGLEKKLQQFSDSSEDKSI